MKTAFRLLPAIALAAVLPALHADEVTDNLDAAKSAYEAGNYSEAIQSIDYANQLIRQKKGEEVMKLLPDAPKGWEAEEPEVEAAATGLLGGGITATRRYSRGNSSASIKIQSDSAVLQYAAMLSNPMLAGAGGAKMETIKGQRVTVKFQSGDDNGTVTAVVDNRYVVEFEGNSLTRDDLLALVKAFDFKKLAAMQ